MIVQGFEKIVIKSPFFVWIFPDVPLDDSTAGLRIRMKTAIGREFELCIGTLGAQINLTKFAVVYCLLVVD